jgi:hypothetical protein
VALIVASVPVNRALLWVLRPGYDPFRGAFRYLPQRAIDDFLRPLAYVLGLVEHPHDLAVWSLAELAAAAKLVLGSYLVVRNVQVDARLLRFETRIAVLLAVVALLGAAGGGAFIELRVGLSRLGAQVWPLLGTAVFFAMVVGLGIVRPAQATRRVAHAA